MAVLEKNTMINLAESTVKAALKLGASEAEAYVYDGKAFNVGLELGQISKASRNIDQGIGVRIVANKAVGFAYTNIVDDQKTISTIVERALKAARASKPDPEWNGLPQKKPNGKAEGTFDQRIVDLKPEDLIRVTSTMLDAASSVDKRVFPIEGGVGSGYVSAAIANSNDVSGYDRGTFVECSLATLAKDGGAVTPICFEFNASRSYHLDPEWVGKEAAKLSVSALKPKPTETKTSKVILTQFALQELFSYTLMGVIKADSVQRDQSPFKGKLNQEVASEKLTIYDDGLYPSGLRTSVLDGEGVPRQKTKVIERGILQGFLYDDYTAKKERKESTGNASRAGYLSTPSIETTNLHIVGQKESPEQMIREVDEGFIIYYLQGAHSSNPVSGEFSVVATPCWKINNGEIAHSCKGVMLAGNVFDLLKNITIVGNNERQMGVLIAPWVEVENMKVIGK